MAITDIDGEQTDHTVRATVAVRVPAGTDRDLPTAARERLATTDGVGSASIDGLDAIEPRLSAVVATVSAHIESTVPAEQLREEFDDTVYVEEVQRIAAVPS